MYFKLIIWLERKFALLLIAVFFFILIIIFVRLKIEFEWKLYVAKERNNWWIFHSVCRLNSRTFVRLNTANQIQSYWSNNHKILLVSTQKYHTNLTKKSRKNSIIKELYTYYLVKRREQQPSEFNCYESKMIVHYSRSIHSLKKKPNKRKCSDKAKHT